MQQKNALRIMAGLEWRERCKEAFKQLHILTVANVYILEVISYSCQKGPLYEMRTCTNTTLATRKTSTSLYIISLYTSERICSTFYPETSKKKLKSLRGYLIASSTVWTSSWDRRESEDVKWTKTISPTKYPVVQCVPVIVNWHNFDLYDYK